MPEMGAASKPRIFPCPQCPMTYNRKQHLNEHIKVHCPDNPHVCPLCDKVCPNSHKLTVHMRSHTREKLFKCSANGCGKEFTRRQTLEIHMQSHQGEKMEPKPTCAICGTTFTTTEGLKVHNWKFHNPQKKQHPCVTCGKVFILSWHFRRHLLTHLPRIRTLHVDQKDTRNKNHVCSFCGWKFMSPSALTVHLRTHTGEKPFKCPTCSKALATKDSLQNHMKLHTGENLEECQFCGRKFTSSHSLTQHLLTHTGGKPFKCATCTKAFTTKVKLESHSKVHMEVKPEECQFCGRRFTWKTALNRHIRTHTGEAPYKCEKCGRAFRDLITLKMHRRAKHSKEQRDEDGQTPTHTQVEDQDPLHIPSENKQELSPCGPSRPVHCLQCPKTYRLRKSLDQHMKVHSPDNPHVCPLCNKGCANDSHLTAHIRSHTGEKLFKCAADGCGKEFALRYSLERHMRAHHGQNVEPKPTCAFCRKSFATGECLRNHNMKFHNAEKTQHPCVTCGKVYVLLAELKQHLQTHLHDDPQDCPICGKSCRNGPALKEHLYRHDWEGTYKCEHCAKDFQTSKYLTRHIRTVHCGLPYNKTGNHECSLCGRKLRSPSHLATHLRTHTGEKPFKCTTSPKAYSTNCKLRAPCKVHTGEKPEECQFCGRGFGRKNSLNMHIRTHTGEKSYKCDKCGKAFGDPTALKKHRLAIHPEEQREGDPQTPTHTQVNAQDPLHIPYGNKQGLNSGSSAKLDLQVAPTDTNPESQERETPVALHPPGMGAASEARPFQCPHCLKTYRFQGYLNTHLKICNPDNLHVCPLCNSVWANSSKLTRHMRSHTGEKLFKCSADGCGKEFEDRFHLESHTRIHTEPKPICAICGTSFTNTLSLNSHNWKFHNPQKKQQPCVTCGKVFPSVELKRHLETHLPDDPQECPICGKSCRNGFVLKEHVYRHSWQGNNNCEHCLQNFTTKSLLRKHIRTVHDGQKHTRNKHHACSICGWKLVSSSALAVHLRTHTGEKPFKCPTCSKAFATNSNLRAHCKVHTGEKPEECQFCGRRFTLSHSLTLHLRTHTGENPYKCEGCGEAFRWRSSLDRHKTLAHSGEQQKETSTHAHTDGIVPMDPLTDTPTKNPQKNDPLAEVVEYCSQLYLDNEFRLHQLTVPVQRMKLKNVGGGVLELRSGGECWYVCSKCGRGSNGTLIRSHALRCQVHQSSKLINETGQAIP